jgi:hypothetical protein
MKNSSRESTAELAGYLGGALIFVALVTFVSGRVNDIRPGVQSALFLVFSIILGAIAFFLGTYSASRIRLATVLAIGSAITLAVALAIGMDMDGPPVRTFIAGALVSNFFFFRLRTELLHIASYGFLGLTCIALPARVVNGTRDSDSIVLTSLFWLALAAIWIYLAFENRIQKTMGYLFASATLFVSVQAQFIQNERLLSYFIAAISVVVTYKLFILEKSWPLLAASIAIGSISLAEFIASTLGGATGAIAGLFTAGVALIVLSLKSMRTL